MDTVTLVQMLDMAVSYRVFTLEKRMNRTILFLLVDK